MCSSDFRWGQWLTGPCLALGRLSVANVVELEDGRARVVLHPNAPARLRHEFLPSVAAGKRYAERWARKWEKELRAQYGTVAVDR